MGISLGFMSLTVCALFYLFSLQGLAMKLNGERRSIRYARWNLHPPSTVSSSTAKEEDEERGYYDSLLNQRDYPPGGRSISEWEDISQIKSSAEEETSRITKTPAPAAAEFYKGRSWENLPQLDSYNEYIMRSGSTSDPSIPENPEGLQDPSLLVGPWEETPDVRDTEAFFFGTNGSVVTAQVGATANISCVVRNRGDHETVSWVRLRDHHLITVGRQTYSSDDRFTVSYNRHSNEWILHLRFVQPRDAGRYVCQVSTHPPMVFIKTLSITEASAKIEGGPEWIVEGGSIVKLRCFLEHHSQAPEYVFWYHNKTMINFNTNRQVQVENTKNGSTLTLMSVSVKDSGNYTCVPSKAQHASILLHVILDDAPAAMQVSSTTRQSLNAVCGLIFLVLIKESLS